MNFFLRSTGGPLLPVESPGGGRCRLSIGSRYCHMRFIDCHITVMSSP
ncbi:hypothetical protein DM46_1905 [Burkholderia mallei]|nr:hypothetical protein DM46_1905 [Burkholderia mallei]